MEDLCANGVGNRADRVGCNTSEVELLIRSGEGKEGNQSFDSLVKVWLEFLLCGVSSGSDGARDGDLDRNLAAFEEDEEALHEEGEVVDDVVSEDLEVRVETRACLLLGRIIDNEVEEDRDNGGVLCSALFREPLAEAAESDTGGSSDNNFGVLQTAKNDWPQLVDVRADVVGASFDDDTKRHKRRFAHVWVGGSHVDLELSGKDREDLLRWKGLGEGIEASESKLK